jgi:hypothetical protein
LIGGLDVEARAQLGDEGDGLGGGEEILPDEVVGEQIRDVARDGDADAVTPRGEGVGERQRHPRDHRSARCH